MKTNLDALQSALWELHADLTEDNVQRNEAKERIHSIVNDLEEIIALHDLWDKGKPKTIPSDFASWYTGTIYCNVKHPKFGKHKVTPRQIKYSSGEYKSKLYKDIIKQAIEYSHHHNDDKLREKLLEAVE